VVLVLVYGSEKMAANSLALHAAPVDVMRPQQFQELYQQYSDTVFLTALRITGNPADAEDVLQTVFLRVLKQEYRFDVPWAGEAYFRRAATNASIDVLRRRAAHAETPLDGLEMQAATESPVLLKQRLRQALARIDPEDAELFLLKYLEGRSGEELAEQFGIQRATVGSRLFRIRQALRDVIEG
jgi:RNA polymerase sigma-70 factor (ECF subfamily)